MFCCHPRNAATFGRSSKGVQNFIHADGVRGHPRFDQDVVRTQLVGSKVRVADHPEVALNSVCDHPAAAGIYPQSALALGTFA
jgi:hypothetical protein